MRDHILGFLALAAIFLVVTATFFFTLATVPGACWRLP